MRHRLVVACFALTCAMVTIFACRATPLPTPDPSVVPVPIMSPAPPNAQGAQATVIIAIPASGASAWVRSPLVRITSVTIVGLSPRPALSDAVVLYGTNDNTLSVTAGYSLGAFNGGGTTPQNMGSAGFSAGAFEYLAVQRTGGTSAALSLVVVGDDGSTSVVTDGGSGGIPVPLPVIVENDASQPVPVSDPYTALLPATNTLLGTNNTLLALMIPYHDAVAVTPSDGGILDGGAACRSIYVGAAGDVHAIMAGGETVLFSSSQQGWNPIQATAVLPDTTTATGLVCGY